MICATLTNDDVNPTDETPNDDSIQSALIKIELKSNKDSSDRELIMIMCSKVDKLSCEWIENKDVEGTHTKEHELLHDKSEEQVEDWAINSRVIRKKHVTTV